MIKKIQQFLSAGVPLFAVVLLAGACFYAGLRSGTPQANGKYVTADKGAVILDAVLNSRADGAAAPGDDAEFKASIVDPVLGVLKKYADAGFVVLDTSTDERGNMVVAAVPGSTQDITPELVAAIKAKQASRKQQ